jgi:hypothetical protein
MLRCVNFNDLYAASGDSDVAKRLQQLTYPYAGTAGLPEGKVVAPKRAGTLEFET